MPITASTTRLSVRVSADLHALLKRAAGIQGCTMADFAIAAVQEAALNAIEQTEAIRLSVVDQAQFVQAVLAPPKPTVALKRAFAKHRKLLRGND